MKRFALTNLSNTHISRQQALEQLSDQCDHSPFELIDACLQGQANKTIQILRHAANNKSESTLILWMLTQEVRILLQLAHLIENKLDFKTACAQLKIWPYRTNLYQLSLKRINLSLLKQLHQFCKAIDEQIKSNLSNHVWNSLEQLALSLCLGFKK